MLAMVALEEEAGKATNGLGFLVAQRAPVELLEIASPEQVERYVLPVFRHERHEAWAITEPGAGSDVVGDRVDGRARRRRVGAERREVVRDRRREGRLLPGARVETATSRRSSSSTRGQPGCEIVRTPRFMHDPYLYQHPELRFTDCRVPDANRVPSGGNEGAKRWFVIERLMIAARCCGASQRLLDEATAWAKEREAFGSAIAEFQAVQFMLADSLTELLAARLLTYHAADAFDSEPDEKVVHGKVAMAKLYASEAAGRIADRTVQIFGGRGYMTEYAAERHYPRASRRPDLGGDERDPTADRRPRADKARAGRRTIPRSWRQTCDRRSAKRSTRA